MQFRIQNETLLTNNLRSLLLANIEIIYQTEESLMATTRLAKKHDLTFYDSSYLFHAIENDAKLLTYDKKLLNAAALEEIKIYD